MQKDDAINSKIYWDNRFQTDWETKSGREQTKYFTQLGISLFPSSFSSLIKEHSLSILDWGCAEGDGTKLLDEAFPDSDITGLDFSEIAIDKAKQNYPDEHFLKGSLNDYQQNYDIIFTSNCLEHFEDPYYWMDHLFSYARHFLIILIPFQELERFEEHFYTFDYDSFPMTMNNFHLVFHQEVISDPNYWPGKQLFLIYANRSSEIAKHINLNLYKKSDILETFKMTEKVKESINKTIELHQEVQNLHSQLSSMSQWSQNLNAEINQKDQMIQDLSNTIKTLNLDKEEMTKTIQKLNEVKEEFTLYNQDLRIEKEKLEVELMDLKKSVFSLENINQSLTSEISQLHQQLLEMSQWANNLKQRIKVFEDSTALTILEKLISKMNSYKQQGTKALIKPVIKSFVPEKVINKIKYKKNMQSFSEIDESLRSNHKVIIAFPIINWEFRKQRPQHILTKFSDNNYTVIYIDMDLIPSGNEFHTVKEAGMYVSVSQISEHIYKLKLSSMTAINIYTDKLSDENFNNIYMGICSVLEHFKIKNPVYMVQFPGWSELVYKLKKKFDGKIVFDCMDDHSGFSSNSKESVETENKLIQVSDLVITSSDLLRDRAKEINKQTILVKNGTQFEHFNELIPNGQLDHLSSKPIIGYYGAISDWFDMDIIEYCANKKRDWNFVLIGSTWGCEISNVEKLENVYFLGEKPYEELPGYLAYFDVCTIPFKIIPLTLATNPVKFYEYISSGKPVVSVCLPELLSYKEYCYLAKDKEEFLNQLEHALVENDDSLRDKRIELAKKNSWEHRFLQIKNNLEKL